jgi:hypothetical protein
VENAVLNLEDRLAEARQVLLVAQADDPGQSYRYQMEKAQVLYHHASQFHSDSPIVWLRLGRLTEIRGLWAETFADQEKLMMEARGHFARAASLNRPEPNNRNVIPPPTVTPEPLNTADPMISEMIFAGRLRRGEIDSDELTDYYAAKNQNPLYQPDLWANRRFVLRAHKDKEARAAAVAAFQEEFVSVIATMPFYVPNHQPNPPVLKKVDLLLAWSETLLSLPGVRPQTVETAATPLPLALSSYSGSLLDRVPAAKGERVVITEENKVSLSRPLMDEENYFAEALEVFGAALKLPLASQDQDILLTRLRRVESLAPDHELRKGVWDLRERLYLAKRKNQSQDPAFWAAWGEDYYSRADYQMDDRLWARDRVEGAKKFAQGLKLSPRKEIVHREWGRVLEYRSNLISARSSDLNETARLARARISLAEAQEQYYQAWERGETLEDLRNLVRVTTHLAFGAEGREEFLARFQEATQLSRHTIRFSENPAEAWLAWATDCEEFIAKSLPQEYKDIVVAEIFAAYNHYLSFNRASIQDLTRLADKVWSIAVNYPEGQDQALSVLVDICRRLKKLAPSQANYSFALGLTLYAQLAKRPAWPDDVALTTDLSAKRAFTEVLSSFLDGLEGLSVWRPKGSLEPEGADSEEYEPLRFLSLEVGSYWINTPAVTFQERLASALNRPLGRLMVMVRPKSLPSWYLLKLASFLRQAAATGYPPTEERMAYRHLALNLLRMAREKSPRGAELGLILAEEGLVLVELNLLNNTPDPSLFKEAETLWAKAEIIAPGSSHYARARWAAWRGNPTEIKQSLGHPPVWEDHFIWPSYQEALKDPAFRAYKDEPWMKAAWYGYAQ